MDFGNALVEALRRRTAARVYGTPFYATELARRAQQVQGGALENQLNQFKLGQEQALAPGELEQQGLRTTGLEIGNQAATAKASKAEQEAAAYQDVLKLNREKADAENAYKAAKGTAAEAAAQARLIAANAAMHRALNPASASGSINFIPMTNTETGEKTLFAGDKKTGNVKPVSIPGYAPVDTGEQRRLTSLQQKSQAAIDGANEGISGINNLRNLYKQYTSAGILAKPQAYNRFKTAVAEEGQRLSRAMMSMTLPGTRGATEARVRAMQGALANIYTITNPAEGLARLDNMEQLIKQTRDETLNALKSTSEVRPTAGHLQGDTGVEEWTRDASGKLVKKQ